MNTLENILNQVNQQNASFQNINRITERSEKIKRLTAINKITVDLLRQADNIVVKKKLTETEVDVQIKIEEKCLLLRRKVDWNINSINKYIGGNHYNLGLLKDMIKNKALSDLDLYEFFKEVGIGLNEGWFYDKNGNLTDSSVLFEKSRDCKFSDFFIKCQLLDERKASLSQKLISLAKDILASKDDTKILELKLTMISWKLTKKNLVKFLVENGITNKDARKIVDFISWNHGDIMDNYEAEDLLDSTKAGTWLLRASPYDSSYRITKKENKNCDDKNLLMSKEDLLRGDSRDYKLWDMLVSEGILHQHPYHYGQLSNKEAEGKLKDTPIGSWLFHFSDNDQKFAFSIKMDSNDYLHLLIVKDKCHNTSLRSLFEEANQVLKTADSVWMRQNIAGISAEFLDPKQAEQKVTELFKAVIQTDQKATDEFKIQKFTKLSRRKFRSLPTSFLIEDKGNQAIEIHQMIHGPGALIGKGSWKIAKLMQNLDSSKRNLVIGKYYEDKPSNTQTLDEIETEFPELRQILEFLRKRQYIAGGHLVALGDKAYMISDYAKTTLDKLIEKGLTDDLKKKYALHLLKGLVFLHANHIAHRDIKPGNVNIIENTQTDEDEACHADLDFATREERPEDRGTCIYQAPELLREANRSFQDLEKIDVYAMGLVLYEIYHGKHWWYDDSTGVTGKNNIEFYNRLINMTSIEFLKIFPEPKKNTVDHLIWQMLYPNPEIRPTAQKALNRFMKILNI